MRNYPSDVCPVCFEKKHMRADGKEYHSTGPYAGELVCRRAELRELYHTTDAGTFPKGSRYIIRDPGEGKGGYLCEPENKVRRNRLFKTTEQNTIFIPGHLLRFYDQPE